VVPTAWLAKVSDDGERKPLEPPPEPPEEETPEPVRETDWGLPAALSVTESVAFSVPVVCGLKLTLIAQLVFTASVLPQVWVSLNEPFAAMPLIFRVAVPVFFSVTVCAALVVPVFTLPKLSEVGLRLATGVFEVLAVPKKSAMAGALAETPGKVVRPNPCAIVRNVEKWL
jgi:hypothetical protein